MQRKDLALRVLSTAAIMSIVTSIAAPAFAGTYYLGEFTGNEFKVEVDANGTVKVNDVEDTTEVVIRGGTAADYTAPAPATGNAEGGSATAATQELEAAGLEDAAGEGQPDPDDAFTLNETEEDSAQNQEGEDTTKKEEDPPKEPSTDNPTAKPKKDVVYEYAPADPNPEQQTTKLAPTSAAPAAKTKEATLADAPAPTTPAAGSATTPTTSVIKVINNWVNNMLKIRLDNVNIKSSTDAAMTVSGNGNTEIELDGKNTLDSSGALRKAGLNKQGNGTMTITADTADSDKLTVKGGDGAAGIGASNITVEGNATVEAEGGKDYDKTFHGNVIYGGAGIEGNGITIRGNAKVKAKSNSRYAAAIGGGYLGDGKNIEISGNAKVEAEGVEPGSGVGAAVIGTGYSNNGSVETSVTIGTAGATSETEHTEVIVKGGGYFGIGGGSQNEYNDGNTKVTIQGGATVDCQGDQYMSIGGIRGTTTIEVKDDAHIKNAKGIIGGTGEFDLSHNRVNGTVDVTIKDNAQIDKAGFIGGQRAKSASVTITGNAKIGEVSTIGADDVAYSHVKILENAVIEKMGCIGDLPNYSGLKEADVTVDGGETGKVKINENAPGRGCIMGKNLTFGNNVLIKLGASSATDKTPVYYVPDDTVHDKIKNNKSAEIWYTNTDGTLYKIIHSEDLCKKGSTQNIIKQPTCTTPGLAEYTCNYEPTNGATNPSCHRTWQEAIPKKGHDWGDWEVTTPATCTTTGVKTRKCRNDPNHVDRQEIPALNHDYQTEWTEDIAPTCTTAGQKSHHCTRCNAITDVTVLPATGHQWNSDNDATHTCNKDNVTESHTYNDWVVVTPATCTAAGKKQHTCTECGHVETQEIPATGHHWKDNGDGTHTCPDCGATEGQPFNTNSALELRVVDAEGMDQPFTVSQNGTLRTYTGAYDTATLTGDLNTLRYLQDHGAQTIQFVTNGQTSSFAISDLLAQGSGSEVFYLTHRGAEEPTLLLVEADHSELVKD